MANITTTFIDDLQSMPSPVLASKNAILIFGVSSKGPLNTPIQVAPEKLIELIGDIPTYDTENPIYWRSAARAYKELMAGLYNTSPLDSHPIYIVRIGNASKAAIDLYEKVQTKYAFVSTSPVINMTTSDPSTLTPSSGDRYIVASGASGVWAGHEKEIAEYDGSAWNFIQPAIGLTLTNNDDSNDYTYDGSDWVLKTSLSWNVNSHKSINIESVEYATSANLISTIVNKDSNGNPTGITITIPAGDLSSTEVSKTFYFTNYKDAEELVNAINNDSDISKFVIASFEYLHTSVSSSYDGSSLIFPTKDINEIGSDAVLKSIESVKIINNNVDFSGETVGLSTLTLDRTPAKDGTNPTLTDIRFNVENEAVANIQPAEVGQTAKIVTLGAVNSGYWSPSAVVDNIVITKNDGSVTLTNNSADNDWYEYDSATGQLTIHNNTGFALGDSYIASYSFDATMNEVFNRSDLDTSVINQFFVTLNTIIFTNPLPYNIQFTYKSVDELSSDKYYYDVNSDTITLNGNVTIVNGDLVLVESKYIPAVPAPSGDTLDTVDGSVIQASYLANGNSGMNLSETQYMKAVADAFNKTQGVPARYMIVAGAFMDNIVKGIDYETGMSKDMRADYASLFTIYLDYKNKYVSQCEGFLAAKPLTSTDADKQREYLRNLYDLTYNNNNAANAAAIVNSKYMILCASMGEYNILDGYQIPMEPSITVLAGRLNKPKNVSLKGFPVKNSGSILLVDDNNIYEAINNLRFTFAAYDHDYENTMVFYDAPTAAPYTSQWRRQFVNEIVYDIVNDLRSAAKPFIGRGVDVNLPTAMKVNLGSVIKDKYIPDLINNFRLTFNFEGDRVTKRTKIKVYIENKAENIGIDFEISLEGNGGV